MIKNIKYYTQPTNISCGPTCIKMVYDSQPLNEKEYSIMDICELCGTDSIVGTPPDRMELGMKALGMTYVEHIGNDNPFTHLHSVLESGNIPVIRTITHGIPHWIIAKSFDGKKYEILDPALGEIKYTEAQLKKVWNPRNYQFFEIIVNGN